MYDDTMIIRIHGADGSIWPVHGGEDEGDRGVFMMAEQVEGLFSAPIRQSWTSGALEVGGTQDGMWYEVRDLNLGFIITGEVESFAVTRSKFRQAFVPRLDRWDHAARMPRIEAWTAMSGSRFLDVLMYDKSDFNPGNDPLQTEIDQEVFPLRAGQPFYYSDDEVDVFTSNAPSASGTLTISNPCPLPMYHKFVVTRCKATLPDFSWAGAPGFRVPGVDKLSLRDDSHRTILCPQLTVAHGGATVDLEHLIGNTLMIRDASDQNLLGQMPVPGKYFTYEIPPWTPPTEIPVSYTGAPAGGAAIKLIMPRRWDEPFGGEWMGLSA